MAKKQIMLVYQDCPMCGARKNWGDAQTKIATDHGFDIIKTPYYATGVKGLIMRACEAGIGHLPFFTDGKKFSYNLEDFVEKPERKTTRRKRNTRTKRKGTTANGDSSKD